LISFGFFLVYAGLILTQARGAWFSLASPAVMIAGFVLLGTGYRIQVG
jgi:hypothetical protein